MNTKETTAIPKKIRITYDKLQHCTALKEPQGKTVSVDCPYTGKGEEFSPMNLLSTSLAGCLFLSMGALAMRHELDLTGACAQVAITATDPPTIRVTAIDIVITMPHRYSEPDRLKLERAAETCPIKHCFDPAIPITVGYHYPG